MSPLQLRPYQEECFQRAKKSNTIVHLPTGFGKTLVAARLVEYYLNQQPEKKVAFLVPTRPLVEQQSQYLKDHCQLESNRKIVVQQLIGEEQSWWQQSEWDDAIEKSHVFCGTAAIFEQAFVSKRTLDVGKFALFVSDECHNAKGSSPMASVMRDAVALHYLLRGSRNSPRILGLTASFDNANSKDLHKTRQELEELLQGTIICPEVQERIADKKFQHVAWEPTPGLEGQVDTIEQCVKAAIVPIESTEEMSKIVRRCSHVYTELGYSALFFFIDEVILQQIIEKIKILRALSDNVKRIRCAESLERNLPRLRKQSAQLLASLEHELRLNDEFDTTKKTRKLDRLIEVLEGIFLKHGTDFRGIIFVEQVALVSTLAKLLNDAFQGRGYKFGAVAGRRCQTENDRQCQLDKFTLGELVGLVSSAALEEGIDVPECGFVVRFTSFKSTRAHIQGSGRARHKNAEIFYFDNSPTLELSREAKLKATARDASTSLTSNELDAATAKIALPFTIHHPYPDASTCEGLVTLFNCKQIFIQYCSQTLGMPVQPKKDLYRYLSLHRHGFQKILLTVRFPTPKGWRMKSTGDVVGFWKYADRDHVSTSDRTKRKTLSEKEEMKFVYVVVLQLRLDGYLDAGNSPCQAMTTRRACRLDDSWPDETISIKNTVFQSYSP